MSEIHFATLSDRALIRLSGSESASFLNALLSRDIRPLAVDRALHAGLLTPKGKLSFDFLLVATGDEEILIDCDARQRDALLEQLSLYRLRAKVDIKAQEQGRHGVIAAWGRDVCDYLSLPCRRGAAAIRPDNVVFVDPRLPQLGARILPQKSGCVPYSSGGHHSDAQSYRKHRLSLGVPEGDGEVPRNQFFPWEASLDLLDGVSLDKGCFIGQEIVSRVYRKGRVRRRLMPVFLRGKKYQTPRPGDAIRQNGESIGSLHIRHGAQALALMQMDRIGDRVAPMTIGETDVELVVPEWMKA